MKVGKCLLSEKDFVAKIRRYNKPLVSNQITNSFL